MPQGGHPPHHSITSSARTSSAVGTVRPSALAVLRLTYSSILVACWTGRSAGFSPFRIRPGKKAPLRYGTITPRAGPKRRPGAAKPPPLEADGTARAARHRSELLAVAGEEWIAEDQEPACPQLDHLCEDSLEVAFRAGVEDVKLQPEPVRGRPQGDGVGLRNGIGRIDQERHDSCHGK